MFSGCSADDSSNAERCIDINTITGLYEYTYTRKSGNCNEMLTGVSELGVDDGDESTQCVIERETMPDRCSYEAAGDCTSADGRSFRLEISLEQVDGPDRIEGEVLFFIRDADGKELCGSRYDAVYKPL